MAKIFMLKGKTIEELRSMSLEEFAKILPTRQRRTILNGFNAKQKKFLERLRGAQKLLRTHCREIIIIPEMVGKKVMIHNGKEWVAIEIKQEMLGHRLGEFALTRKPVKHSAPGVGATRSSKFLPLK